MSVKQFAANSVAPFQVPMFLQVCPLARLIASTVLAGIGGTIFLTAPASAEWILVGENAEGDRFHVSDETVTPLSNDIVIFDTMISHAQPKPDGTVVTVDRFVADCRNNTVSNVSWVAFGQNQQVINANALPTLEAHAAPAGTLIESEIQLACSMMN